MDYVQATDAMYRIVTDTASTFDTILGYKPQIIYNNMAGSQPPDGTKVWLRCGRTTAREGQAALATECGAPGQQLFDTDGLLWVQFFLPMADPKSDQYGQQLANAMRDAFRRTRTDDLWFRNSRVSEVQPENETIRYNVIAEFHHTSIY